MVRKIISSFLAVALILTTFMFAPAMAGSPSTEVTTTRATDRLFVRKGPHKGNTPVVGSVGDGDILILLDINDETNPEAWSKVRVKATGAEGYLKNKYIAYFGLDNSDGEVDKTEDDGSDYASAPDNDGKKGSSFSSGSSSSKITLGVVSTSNGGSVNVRKSASASSSALGQAADGEHLQLLSKSGSWYRVKTEGGLTGYIYATYVDEGIPGTTTAKSGVNLRKGAGTGYSTIKTLPYGTSITVLARSGSWVRVKAGSTYGYIHTLYYAYK